MWRILRSVTVVSLVVVSPIAERNVVGQSPSAPGLPWMNPSLSPEQRADLLIAQMTLAQKVQQISNDVRPAQDSANRPKGCGFAGSGRHIQGIAALGIPTVRMTNGSTGIIGGDCTNPVGTGVPSTSAVAATFNPAMGWQLGDILGDEARRHGHQVLLGPTVNPVRHPYGGRNYQLYSEDPYLSGLMGSETIKGIQAHGIHAVPKHYAGNEQETSRRFGDSAIPPRALHEIYLLPFEMAVRDTQPASIMCAYNRLNGVSACSSEELLDGTLRDRWGFGGYVMTDRSALHDLAPSIKAGVDWELAHRTPVHYALEPQPDRPDNKASEGIRPALAVGSITVGDIDQMLRRRYVQMFKAGHFETDFDVLFAATPDFFSHGLMAREIAEQAIVLLKNDNNILPLSTANLQSVALIGAPWFAGVAKLPVRGGDDNTPFNEPGNPPYSVTPQQGLENVLRSLGSPATVTYESGGGTGTRADIDKAVALAKKSEVVIVMVGDDPSEGCDLQSLRLPIVPPADMDFCAWEELTPGEYTLPTAKPGTGTDQEALMRALTSDPVVAQKMVVVLKTQGMVVMPWLNKVPALLEAWYPGQEDGNVVANVLFGLRNPSGKLPVTFGTSEREAAYATPEQFPGVWGPAPFWADDEALSPQYSEGMQVGYRWYEANGVTPLFPFGFGLSYTTFAYGGLSVSPALGPSGAHAVLSVTYTITNTGTMQGAEASQVYLRLPAAAGQPSKRLVGFRKVDLMPGESRQVTVTIDSSASNHPFSYWQPVNDAPVPGWTNGEWKSAPGDYTVYVGTSSADTPLVSTVTLPFSEAPVNAPLNNFSGARASDIVIWRPDSGTWFIKEAATNYTDTTEIQWGFGWLGDQPVPADYDGDGVADVAVWRNSDGTWYVKTSSTQFSQFFAVQWGSPGDRPFAGDLDGDRKADLVVWRPSNGVWYVLTSSSGYQAAFTVHWGSSAFRDVPVPGDFDGDGRVDLAVWRPDSGTWWVSTSTSNYASHFIVQWGAGALGDVPLVGDFDGDLRADMAVWRPSGGTWWVKLSSTDYESWFAVQWGADSLGDVPVVADFDGDGRTDISVWRPGDGTWWVKPSSSGYSSAFTVQWGVGSLDDRPIGGVSAVLRELLTVDSVHVARVRESLRRGEPQFQAALTALKTDANGALNVGPASVLDKRVTPPSGDKHDYMSQAPYWWPDASEPDGRPYIRRDGRRNPEIDRITDRANLGRLERTVSSLALAFHLTGQEKYAAHALRLIRVWFLNPATRMNPHLQFGQGIPGIAEGQSAGIIETRFLPTIIDGMTLLHGSSALTVSDEQAFKDWMRAYLTWLLESPFGRDQARRGNNQETWADVQVVALAIYTGETGVARKVVEEARADIAEEFDPDGRQPREIQRTRAWDYSIFDLTAFLHLAALGERVGVDLWNYSTADGRSLRKGVEYLVPFATGTKPFPHEQITEFRPSALHRVLRMAAVGWNEPRYQELAHEIGGATRRLELTLP